MPYSKCPYCKKCSYSAAETNSWICPYCNRSVDKIDTGENKTKEHDK